MEHIISPFHWVRKVESLSRSNEKGHSSVHKQIKSARCALGAQYNIEVICPGTLAILLHYFVNEATELLRKFYSAHSEN